MYPPETGLFLVRESTNYPGDYTLCVSCDSKVEHYRIIYHKGKLSIDEEEFFGNLMQLVEVRDGVETGRPRSQASAGSDPLSIIWLFFYFMSAAAAGANKDTHRS